MGENKNKSDKKNSNKLAVTYGLKDPAIAKIVMVAFVICILLAFAVCIISVVFLSSASAHNGLIYVGGKYSVALSDPQTGLDLKNGAVFKETSYLFAGDKVGVVSFDKNGSVTVSLRTVEYVDAKQISFTDKPGFRTQRTDTPVLGTYVSDIDSAFVLSVVDDPMMFLLFDMIFVVLAIILGLVYFLVSPKGAKKYEQKKKEESGETPPVVAFSNDNASLLMTYLSTDDNIKPSEDEDEVAAITNTNYYNSVRLHDGEVYTVVKKYPAAARAMEEYGASDMDIIKMNMIGNAEFDNLILMPHKEKTLTMQEVIDYVASLEGVYCIKKRGTLNWVYKYKSKTILIVKENDDHNGYKVSVKVYPDAAEKINIIYKALEDSTFPIGPFWYMFNNLRNLPGNVIKWLIAESYKISQWQQIRADILRDTPSLESLGYDALAIRTAILSGTPVTAFDKFTVITQTADETNKYACVLETGFNGVNVDDFTKEFTMLVPYTENLSFSILAKKTASETLTNSFCNEMLSLCTQNAAPATQEEGAAAANRVVRRSTVKKKRK